jgi:hypothetical protein
MNSGHFGGSGRGSDLAALARMNKIIAALLILAPLTAHAATRVPYWDRSPALRELHAKGVKVTRKMYLEHRKFGLEMLKGSNELAKYLTDKTLTRGFSEGTGPVVFKRTKKGTVVLPNEGITR